VPIAGCAIKEFAMVSPVSFGNVQIREDFTMEKPSMMLLPTRQDIGSKTSAQEIVVLGVSGELIPRESWIFYKRPSRHDAQAPWDSIGERDG
jgi:hypothetical protein